ncbi:Retrovirus-related Pol polyprotein from transposon [Smittium culicis]|uniref:Retrovirus-related Pol polyprotein from transposon n=1 Tax=Smittium culicis TaxID=133412 RepID=A0A1R1XQX0_9FUNG|nr:Retrovirus-related Pol polyprotein from transposon [Smittium culicis]
MLISSPQLSQPDFNKKFIPSIDVSSYEIGVLLEQKSAEKDKLPIFDFFTDNSAVSRIYNQIDATGRISCWISYLSEYDFTIYHRSGKDNQVSDLFSRPVMLEKGEIGELGVTSDKS